VAKAARAPRERLIKRYDNRKLYDVADRRYVTMADLSQAIAGGEEVRVEDQKTGEDLTTVVLAQVVLENLKQRTTKVPSQVLTRLIRLGSRGATAATWSAAQDTAARAREEGERIAAGLLSRGRLTFEEAAALRQEIVEAVGRLVGEAQRSLETRLHGLLDIGPGGDAAASLDTLKERLLAFETYLSKPKGRKRRR
jgi:polyhydroxyalkanoate synthesis repressor PhaR